MNEKKTFTEKLSGTFDKAISVFSPKAGFRRRMYREAIKLSEAFTAYKGASRSRLRSNWLPGHGSADEDLLPELSDIRERSRDLNRNDAHASGITGTMTVNVVGSGIRPQSRIDKESIGMEESAQSTFQKQAEKCWKRWLPYADAGERMDFCEIQNLVDRQILENGEAIIMPLMLPDKDRPYSLALQAIESDRLDTPPELRGDKSVRSGVKVGDRGQPLSYFIRKSHPGDYRFTKGEDALRETRIDPERHGDLALTRIGREFHLLDGTHDHSIEPDGPARDKATDVLKACLVPLVALEQSLLLANQHDDECEGQEQTRREQAYPQTTMPIRLKHRHLLRARTGPRRPPAVPRLPSFR